MGYIDFKDVTDFFEKLENHSKKLEKTLLLRDFILEHGDNSLQVLDVIAGNFQREINKKSIGISLKTCFEVLSFVTREDKKTLEEDFNKKGDIGLVAKDNYKEESQQSLSNENLRFKDITSSLKTISEKSGKESNKVKKEILSKLFLQCQTRNEYKFLARLLVDDLRIGVMEGIIKEACINTYLPKIKDINIKCQSCGYWNLNMKKCFSCGETLDTKNQDKYIEEKKVIKETSKEKTLEYPNDYIISFNDPRELYNYYLNIFEKKYNILNSFTRVIEEIKVDKKNILKSSIILGVPIKSMLGIRSDSIEEGFNTTGKPTLIDFKYDGIRVQIHNKKGKIWLFTRKLEDITKQFPEITKYIENNFSSETFVIDAECVGYDFSKGKYLPFQTLSRRILSKEYDQVSHIKVIVKIFDVLYYQGESLIELPYSERRDKIPHLLLQRPIRQKLTFNIEDLLNLQ